MNKLELEAAYIIKFYMFSHEVKEGKNTVKYYVDDLFDKTAHITYDERGEIIDLTRE
jgi:divalent metal cation (Fe/Co/Zn/Cd) transporter